MTTPQFQTSTKTRILYSLTSLGITIPGEAVAGVIAFYIVDIRNLPVFGIYKLAIHNTIESKPKK